MTSCRPWPCECRPHAATFHARCGPAAIVLLHSVACTRGRARPRAQVARHPARDPAPPGSSSEDSVTYPEQARRDLAEILNGGPVEISDAQAQMSERGHRLAAPTEPAARLRSRRCGKARSAAGSGSPGGSRRAARPACAYSVPLKTPCRRRGAEIEPPSGTTGRSRVPLSSRHHTNKTRSPPRHRRADELAGT